MSDPFDAHYGVLRSDPEARRRLIADPKAELARFFGSPLPDGDYRIEIIDQRPDTITVMIPTPPQDLSDAEASLGGVAGRVLDLLFTTGIGGYLIPNQRLTWLLRDLRSTWAGDSADSG